MAVLIIAEVVIFTLALFIIGLTAYFHFKQRKHQEAIQSWDEELENETARIMWDAYTEAMAEGKLFRSPRIRGTAGDELIEEDRFPF